MKIGREAHGTKRKAGGLVSYQMRVDDFGEESISVR
jgi:hypothetical protein